jgi:hypothetical protein
MGTRRRKNWQEKQLPSGKVEKKKEKKKEWVRELVAKSMYIYIFYTSLVAELYSFINLDLNFNPLREQYIRRLAGFIFFSSGFDRMAYPVISSGILCFLYFHIFFILIYTDNLFFGIGVKPPIFSPHPLDLTASDININDGDDVN